MSPMETMMKTETDRVPRASGDEPGDDYVESVKDRCSPRERG